jgi:type II secretory pathway component PulF
LAQFEYTAYDEKGKLKKGYMEGAASSAVIGQLENRGFIVVDVNQVQQVKKRGRARSLSLEAQTMFCRSVSSYLKSGLSLADTLKLLSRQTSDKKISAVYASILEEVQGGRKFSVALGESGVFRESLRRVVESGEQSGTLTDVLEQAAEQLKLEISLRRKVRAALTYPLVMVFVGLGVVSFLLAYVVPKLASLFADLGQELPLPTRILMTTSSMIRSGAVPLLVLFLVFMVYLRRKKKSIPLFRKLRERITISVVTSQLSTLMNSGIPLVQALRMSAPMDKRSERWINVAGLVKEGHRFDMALEKEGSFPEEMVYIIRVGEMGGDLPGSLKRISENNWEIAESQMERLASLIEPVLVLTLGIVVGFIVVAILMPIFDLSSLVK